MQEPIRHRSHTLEDISRNVVKHVFITQGWVSVDLSPDYGEDELVFIYENDRATGELFFAQIKSVESERHYSRSRDSIRYPLNTASLRRWTRLSLPVVLIVYIHASTKCYWLVTQSYLQEKGIDLSRVGSKTKSVYIPLRNALTKDTLPRLRQDIAKLVGGLPRPQLISLRDVLKEIEVQLEAVTSWTDQLATEKRIFDQALEGHERMEIAKFPGLYRKYGRVSHASPERHSLYGMLEQRIKEIPEKDVDKALTELRQFDHTLLMLQKMLLQKHPNGASHLLVRWLSQLQLTLVKVANRLDDVLRNDMLTVVPSDAQEIRGDIEKARDIIEQIKWVALDLILNSSGQNRG